jgi:hypothetical protein
MCYSYRFVGARCARATGLVVFDVIELQVLSRLM